MKKIYIIGLLLIVGLLAACTGGETAEPAAVAPAEQPEVMVEQNPEPAMEEAPAASEGDMMHDESMAEDGDMAAESAMEEADHEVMAAEPMEETAETMMELDSLPAWGQIALTNARTGESFTLADFAGKTVYVEPMATWCTNCRQQLTNVRSARDQLNSDETQFIALSLETQLDDQTLAQYADNQGFDWLFAVMPQEMVESLVGQFGPAITSAPSTPHFVIRPDSTFTGLMTGIDSADEVLGLVQAAQG